MFGWILAITQDAEKKKWELLQKTLGVLWTAEQFKSNDSNDNPSNTVIIPLAVGINPEIVKEAKKALQGYINNDFMDRKTFKNLLVEKDLQSFID